MTAAEPIENSISEIVEELRRLYPGSWGSCLIRVCEAAKEHTHPRREDGEWVERPCDSVGKKPLGADWNGSAMDRLGRLTPPVTAQAHRQLEKHLEFIARHIELGGNVGLVMPPGLMAIDIDDSDSMALAEGIDALSDAPCQLTSKGGHFIVQAPPEAAEWPQRVKLKVDNGLTMDLRLPEKGQIVAEPSINASGTAYEWLRELPETQSELPMLSDVMIEMISKAVQESKKPNRGPKSNGHNSGRGEKIREGGRNDHLTRGAGHLHNAGMRGRAFFDALNVINVQDCDPPLSKSEVWGIVNSAARGWERNESTQANEWSPEFEPLANIESKPLPEFPVSALGAVAPFVASLASSTQTPPDIAGTCALGFMAGAVARKAVVDAGWEEELSLYLAAVAEPGSRKSEVHKQTGLPIREYESDRAADLADEIRDNKNRLALLEKRLKKEQQLYAKAESDLERSAAQKDALDVRKEIEELRLSGVLGAPRLLAADITPEKLASLLATNDERLILASAEGAQVIDRSLRYSNHDEPNIDLLLSAHDGERCSIDRQSADTIVLKRPVLTVVTTIQPHSLETLGKNPAFTGRGLTARFAYSIPSDVRGYRNVRDTQRLNPGAVGDYRNVMSRLLALPHIEGSPQRLRVDGIALDVFHDFAERIELGQREDGEFEDMRGWASKAAGLVLRIAGVLALAEGTNITPEAMRRSVELGDYFAAHSKRAFEMMQGLTSDPIVDKAWGWIARHARPDRTFSRRDLYQGVKGGRIKVVADLDPSMEKLRGAGRIAQVGSKPTGGRRSEVWAVNPEAMGRSGSEVFSNPGDPAPNTPRSTPEEPFGGNGGSVSRDQSESEDCGSPASESADDEFWREHEAGI
jgi:replicative DNA helicase